MQSNACTPTHTRPMPPPTHTQPKGPYSSRFYHVGSTISLLIAFYSGSIANHSIGSPLLAYDIPQDNVGCLCTRRWITINSKNVSGSA